MIQIARGRYRARRARTPQDLTVAQRLRALAFHSGEGLDSDAFDAICDHMLIEEVGSGTLVCCFRVMFLSSGPDINKSYSAQYYDLSGLESFGGPMVELGRFCIHPERTDPDILRVAWGAITAFVDARGVGLLFGCASFVGTDACAYHDAFALLRARHLAPGHWSPRVKAPNVVRFATGPQGPTDPRKGMQRMPPLLRTYLIMGGWVSDHAVVDGQMNTLHVFTGLEIAAIPPARQKLLRAVAG